MRLSVTAAKARLADLVRRAEAGEEVVLTRHGRAVARLVAVKACPDARRRGEIIDAIRASAASKATSGPGAARSQDFLYDDQGMPR